MRLSQITPAPFRVRDAPHLCAVTRVEARDRNVVRSLLIAPIYAASMLTGGGQRTFHICRALARLGSVDLVLISEPSCLGLEREIDRVRSDFSIAGDITIQHSTSQFLPAPPAQPSLAARCLYFARRIFQAVRPRAHFYEPSPEAVEALRRSIQAKSYDVLVVRYLQCAALSGAFEQELAPVMVDLDDLDEIALQSRMEARTTSIARKLLLLHQTRQVRAITANLRKKCQHLFVASEADRAFLGLSSCSVLPNIPFRAVRRGDPPDAPVDLSSFVVLFVGTYGHRANRDGLLHFVAHCWPSIRTRVPAARLRVVGSGGWEMRREELEKCPGISVVGTVPDLDQEYASAAICVVPLFEGSGTKIKVLEALMYGRPVVASKHSARGYDDLVGRGVVLALDDRQMAGECVRLLQDPATRVAMAEIGRSLVAANYSFDTVLRSVESGVRRFANRASDVSGQRP